MLKNCYFEPCLLQVLSTLCVIISVTNPIFTLRYSTDRILWQILQFLRANHAKIIESIQTRRTRVELIVADQIPEGKKSKSKEKWSTARMLPMRTVHHASTVHVSCSHCSPVFDAFMFLLQFFFSSHFIPSNTFRSWFFFVIFPCSEHI